MHYVTYNLKFNRLSIQFYGSYFEVHTNSANVTFCVCVILQGDTESVRQITYPVKFLLLYTYKENH